MKSFFKSVLLAYIVLPFVVGDLVMGAPGLRQANASDVVYKGVKLGIDSPPVILKELADGDWSDDHFPGMKQMGDAWAAAKFYLAQCYLLGHNGCAKDEKKAAELFQASFYDTYLYWLIFDANGRNQRIPGEIQQRGNVGLTVTESLAAHVERKRQEAARGDRNASYTLGIYYALAMGVQRNLPEAEKNFRKAAELGHKEAQFNLGIYHANPTIPGVSNDLQEAERWLRLAAGQGHEDAKIMLDEISEERRERRLGSAPRSAQSEFHYYSGTRGASQLSPSVNTSQSFRLTPGDVILEINGERIGRQEDVTSAIARSPQTMYLTVRDGRTGTVARFATTLSSSRPRFGVTHQTHPGGGSRVTGVNSNSPATRLVLAE